MILEGRPAHRLINLELSQHPKETRRNQMQMALFQVVMRHDIEFVLLELILK